MQEARVAVVTGANSGIGFETCQELAKLGYTVAMVCRNETKAKLAKQLLLEKTPHAQVIIFIADVSVIGQVRDLSKRIISAFPRVHLLVNNAGSYFSKPQLSTDGLELTFATNYVSMFELTRCLLPALMHTSEARIINVASEAQLMGTLEIESNMNIHHYASMRAYGSSKLYAIMHTMHLASLLSNTNVVVHSMHPGGVHTNFGQHVDGILGIAFRWLGWLMRTPAKGAETIVWLATSTEIMKTDSGAYWYDRKIIRAQNKAYDRALQQTLWNMTSARIAAISPYTYII